MKSERIFEFKKGQVCVAFLAELIKIMAIINVDYEYIPYSGGWTIMHDFTITINIKDKY